MEGACACGWQPSASQTLDAINQQVTAENRPTCNPPGGVAPQTTQYFSGAYPPPRHLAFLKAIDGQARLGSICPRYSKEDVNRSATHPSFGYNPALGQIAEWLRDLPKYR